MDAIFSATTFLGWLLLAAGLPASIVTLATAPWMEKALRLQVFLLLLAVGMIGALVGGTGGMSRVGVVGDLVPAALTTLGAATVYLFSQDRPQGSLVSLSVICFCVAMGFSYSLNANLRGNIETRQMCIDIFSNPEIIGNSAALQVASSSFGPTCEQVFRPASNATQDGKPR